MNPAENYILSQKEPFRSIMLQIQVIIEATIPDLDLKYKWKLPYYYLMEKPFCYLNVTKGYVDIGIRYGDYLSEFNYCLISENRKSFKSLRYYSLNEINHEVLVGVLESIKNNGYNGFWKKNV